MTTEIQALVMDPNGAVRGECRKLVVLNPDDEASTITHGSMSWPQACFCALPLYGLQYNSSCPPCGKLGGAVMTNIAEALIRAWGFQSASAKPYRL